MKREIILIDEEKCNGCGNCIDNCAEGAMEIVNGKARLVSDSYCDGLGACLSHCPQDALNIIKRDAPDFDEEAVNIYLKKMGRQPLPVGQNNSASQKPDHSSHAKSGCPSARVIKREIPTSSDNNGNRPKAQSMLGQWPIQLKLVPANAPFLDNADLIISADCAPFAYPDFHETFLKGNAIAIGCPKLDNIDFYIERMTEIFTESTIKSITVVHMEVPCCFGLNHAVDQALSASKKEIPLKKVTIGINGEIV